MNLDLAALNHRWRSRAVIAISVESGRTTVDLLRLPAPPATAPVVEQSLLLPLSAEALLADPDKAGQQLAALLESAGIRERRCVICVPPSWALTTSADVPEISGEDLRGYLELRAEREFPIPVNELRLAHCAYALPGGKAQLTLAAVATKRLSALERMVQGAGCQAISISLGLDECLQADRPASLHFIANGDHVALIIAAGSGIAALRTLPGAVEHAEFDLAAFTREVRITLGRLPETLRQEIHAARFGGAPEPAQRLFAKLQQPLLAIGLQARMAESLSAPQDPKNATPNARHPAGAGRLAASRHLQQQALAFEFVVPQTQRWQVLLNKFDSRRRRWILAGAAGAILLLLLTFMVRSSMESSLEKEWAAMSGTVAELETVNQKIRQFRPWFEPGPQLLQVVEGFTGAFPEQGDVWAKSVQLTADSSKLSCTGFARNQTALMSFMNRLRSQPEVTALQLQQVRGDNPVQFSLTYKWETRHAK